MTTRLRCGVLYRFRMVKPPFCAWCPLTNRRKTGCEAELFLKNPKNYFEGFLSGASRISRVWGRHSPTRFPQGQNERKANFGTAVESCSKKVTLPVASIHTTIPAGRFGFSGFTNKAIAAAVSARFSLTRQIKMPFLPAISLYGEEKFLPMLRRIFFSLIPTNQQKVK